MELKVELSKLEASEHFIITVSYSVDQDKVSFQLPYTMDIGNLDEGYLEKVVNFAKSLFGQCCASKPQVKTSSQPLNINGFKPVTVNTISPRLDLPDRSEFEHGAKVRELHFLSEQLCFEVPEEGSDIDRSLDLLREIADKTLLPIYRDKVEYFGELLSEDVSVGCTFSEETVSALNKLLRRCEVLSSDVLVSDSESLADQLNLHFDVDKLAAVPFQFFEALHKEDLKRRVFEVVSQSVGERRLSA